jgi:predicted RNase H-like HicB family nuclease
MMASNQDTTNNTSSIKRQFTIWYQSEEEGGFSGQCLELPGAISQGETIEELIENTKDAINLMLQSVTEEANQQKYKKSLVIKLIQIIDISLRRDFDRFKNKNHYQVIN